MYKDCQFIGFASYFRRYIKNFALIARPLTKLTRKDLTFVWGDEREWTFQQLKSYLVKRPVLALYNVSADHEVHTDASK